MGDAIRTVRHLIDRAADHQPQKTLFIDPESGLGINYGQLRERCLELEGRFQRHGLRLGDFIALLGENSLPLVEHLLASMYAGLIPVPLNLLEASARLSTILKHCKAKAIYASDAQLGHARAAADGCEHRVCLELLEPIGDGSMPHSRSGSPAGQVPIESDAGLLIYTSGTTDRPKGALFTHANLLACAANTARSQALSEHVTQLWVEVFNREDINPNDDFFTLGWTSLLATKLIMRMEREFAVEISLENLLLHPTVSAQVKLLDRAVSQVCRAFLLAPIREGCRQPPLFCIHGVALYRALAVALGPEQPTYGLSPNLVIDLRTGQVQGRFTLHDIAERYLDALREVQPRGPYYLAGFSFGGRVALEIARRLRQAV